MARPVTAVVTHEQAVCESRVAVVVVGTVVVARVCWSLSLLLLLLLFVLCTTPPTTMVLGLGRWQRLRVMSRRTAASLLPSARREGGLGDAETTAPGPAVAPQRGQR